MPGHPFGVFLRRFASRAVADRCDVAAGCTAFVAKQAKSAFDPYETAVLSQKALPACRVFSFAALQPRDDVSMRLSIVGVDQGAGLFPNQLFRLVTQKFAGGRRHVKAMRALISVDDHVRSIFGKQAIARFGRFLLGHVDDDTE